MAKPIKSTRTNQAKPGASTGPVARPTLIPKRIRAQHKLFADAYIANGCKPKAAAVKAGYRPKNADVTAAKLLKQPQVAAYIAERVAKKFDRMDMSADRTLDEIARLAFFDVAELFREDGTLKPVAEIPEKVRSAIAGIDVIELSEGRGHIKKLRLADRRAALDMLMRYHSLYHDKSVVLHKFEDLSDDELERRIDQLSGNKA